MEFEGLPIVDKIKHVWRNITLEPVVLLFAINFGFFAIAADQLYVDKMCQVNLLNTNYTNIETNVTQTYTKEICENIYDYPDLQTNLQQHTTALKTLSRSLQSVPAVLYPLFAGTICDEYGRKPLIVVAILGYTISTTVFLLNTIWWEELKAEFLLFECLQDWSGGSLLFYLGMYSMMADIAKQSNSGSATTRLAIIDGLFHGGFFLGNALAGPVKVNLGLKYNFALGLLFSVTAAAYTIIFIKETLVKEKKKDVRVSNDEYQLYEGTWIRESDNAKISCRFRLDGKLKCRWDEGGPQNVLEITKSSITWDKNPMVIGSYNEGTISWSNGSIWEKQVSSTMEEPNTVGDNIAVGNNTVVTTNIMKAVKGFRMVVMKLLEGFQTVLKKRQYNDRCCLLLLITAFLLEMFTNYQWGNFFMYFRLRLQFRMEDFSTLIAITGWVGLSGQFIFVPLLVKVLKFHDATISILDALTAMVKNTIIALLTTKWMLYFACGIGFLDSTTTTVMRSMIISVVPNNEIGKVFCVVEFFKNILGLTGNLIYGMLYYATVKTVPAAFLYLGVAVKGVVVLVGVLVYIQLNKRQKWLKSKEYSHKKDDSPEKEEETVELRKHHNKDSFDGLVDNSQLLDTSKDIERMRNSFQKIENSPYRSRSESLSNSNATNHNDKT